VTYGINCMNQSIAACSDAGASMLEQASKVRVASAYLPIAACFDAGASMLEQALVLGGKQ